MINENKSILTGKGNGSLLTVFRLHYIVHFMGTEFWPSPFNS